MKKSRFLITLIALSLILTLASCDFFDLLKSERQDALIAVEELAGSEEYASLDKEQVSSIIEIAKREISEVKTKEDIEKAVESVRIQLDALVLGGIMQDASSRLYGCVNFDLYSEANVELITSKMAAANERIFECENAEEVESVLAEAIAEITAIKPALTEAKEAASAALDAYVDLSLYSEENKALVEAEISGAKAEIAGLETINEVEERLISAKAAIDEIPTALAELRSALIAEIEGHISDRSVYTQKGCAELDRIIADAKENMAQATDEEVIRTIADDAKEDLDKVMTEAEELEAAAKAFKDSLVINVNDGDILNDKLYTDGASVIADVAEGNSTRVYFGSQDGNTATVFDAYLTINYRNTEWSIFTLYFRAWDDSSAYVADIRDGRAEFVKSFWNNDIAGKDRTTIIKSDIGIENGKEVHLQVISWGWTKTVLIDGKCVFKIVENDYNAGRIYIETWQAGWTLRNPVYKEYATDDELAADYGEELAKDCVNMTEAEILEGAKTAGKAEIASYLKDVETAYSAENQVIIAALLSEIDSRFDSCKSLDEVNILKEAAKAQLDQIPTLAEEKELADAKITAKAEIASYLKDVEANYSEANRAEIAKIISEGESAIDECKSTSEIDEKVEKIKLYLAAVLTIEQESNAELLTKKEEARAEINAYLSDVETTYSTENQTEISKILSEASLAISAATDKAELPTIVSDAKAKLDAILTIEQERIIAANASLEAFKDTLVHVSGSNIIDKMSVSDGKLIVDSKAAGYGGVVRFGNQDGNMNKAIDFKMTVHYNSNEWSSVTIRFCAWDANTTFKMVITNDSIKIYETSWNDAEGKAVDTLLVEHTSGIANNTEAHIQIITRGWTKAVLINGECILKTWPDKYHVGYTMIETWETGLELRDVSYKEYGSENEVTADYDNELAKESIYTNPY